jgi:hypothetical protein
MFEGSEGLSESSILHHPGHLAGSVRSDRWGFPFGDVGRHGSSKKRKRGSFPIDVPDLETNSKFEARNKSPQDIRVPGNQDEGYQSNRISGKSSKEGIVKPDPPIT